MMYSAKDNQIKDHEHVRSMLTVVIRVCISLLFYNARVTHTITCLLNSPAAPLVTPRCICARIGEYILEKDPAV
jgi:hypothetical protein